MSCRGKKTAKKKPFKEISTKSKRPPNSRKENAFGMWRDHEEIKNVNGHMKKLRKGRKTP